MKKNPYEVLGVSKDATPEEIKKAFREKAKTTHTNKGAGSDEEMAELNNAYEILKSPEKKKRFDETGETSEVTFEARFNGFVQNVFISLVDITLNVEEVDLIKECIDACGRLIADETKRKDQAVNKMTRYGRVKSRLTSESDNKIHFILDVQINMQKENLAQLNASIEFIDQCKEVLKLYKYKTEEKKNRGHHFEAVNHDFETLFNRHFHKFK